MGKKKRRRTEELLMKEDMLYNMALSTMGGGSMDVVLGKSIDLRLKTTIKEAISLAVKIDCEILWPKRMGSISTALQTECLTTKTTRMILTAIQQDRSVELVIKLPKVGEYIELMVGLRSIVFNNQIRKMVPSHDLTLVRKYRRILLALFEGKCYSLDKTAYCQNRKRSINLCDKNKSSDSESPKLRDDKPQDIGSTETSEKLTLPDPSKDRSDNSNAVSKTSVGTLITEIKNIAEKFNRRDAIMYDEPGGFKYIKIGIDSLVRNILKNAEEQDLDNLDNNVAMLKSMECLISHAVKGDVCRICNVLYDKCAELKDRLVSDRSSDEVCDCDDDGDDELVPSDYHG